MQKPIIYRLISGGIMLLLPVVSTLAQPGGGPPPDPGQPVPLQGVAFLLVAGALLGLKKIIDIKKSNKD